MNTADGWSTSSNLTQEYYTIEGAATGDEDISGSNLIGDQAWIYLSGTACSGSLPEIMNNNVLNGFTMPTSPTMITDYALLASYPSSNEAVGVLGCGVNPSPNYKLYEAGLQIAYIPPGQRRHLHQLQHPRQHLHQLQHPRQHLLQHRRRINLPGQFMMIAMAMASRMVWRPGTPEQLSSYQPERVHQPILPGNIPSPVY